MEKARSVVERIEWSHRRLERAKKLIEDGLIQVAQTTKGPLYLCRSQTSKDKLYVVERDACPCEDEYQVNGQKLCKHILARLILEEGIPLKEVGDNPFYWQRNGKQEHRHARRSTPRA